MVDVALDPSSPIPSDLRPAQYQRIARRVLAGEYGDLEPLRMAILGSFTLEFIRAPVVVEAARAGFAVDLHIGDFGQLEQPILDRGSALRSSPRDVLVLAFQPADLAPDVFYRYYATNGSDLDSLCGELIDRLVQSARTYRDETGRPVLVANFALPATVPLGPFDASDPGGLTHRLAAHNATLARRAASEPHVYVWDYAGLVRHSGSGRWSDDRLKMLARVAVASEYQPVMARHLIRTVTTLRRRPSKCLVLDLDNTLWGGVVGDDGLEGIKLGDDWPGTPYKVLQTAALGLRDRGILLALASKNDEAVARAAFSAHPEMMIQWDDLAAIRINWNPKSMNMRSIAEELNIGTDSLVLFDDNPVERAEVRANLPEAGVIDVPSDPAHYAEALLASGYFDQVALSAEDRERAEMYRVERARTELMREAPSLDDFLTGLQMEAEVDVAGRETLGRIAQLVGKTNQFNLTTRRHSQADIARMTESDKSVVGWLRLRDRFGDQGLVCVGIVDCDRDEAHVDTFLMSCRVMNRGVERAMMAYLVERARNMGCSRLIGEYRPTAKNHMVEGLYAELGFAPYEERGDATLWMLDLTSAPDLWPDHILRSRGAQSKQEAAAS